MIAATSDRSARCGRDAERPDIGIIYWGRRGGGAAYTHDLARFCADEVGARRCRLVLRAGIDDTARFRRLGLPTETVRVPLRALASPLAWARGMGDVAAFGLRLSGGAPRIAILPMNFPFAWPLVQALRRAGSHVVYVAHDATPHPGDRARTWQRLTQARLIRAADRIVVPSAFVRDRIVDQVGQARAARVTIAGLETVTRPAAARPGRSRPGGPVRMLFAGRLLAYKGLHLLAQAIAALPAELDWRLTIAGAGPLDAEARRLFGHDRRIAVQIGWLSTDAFGRLFETHDLLLAPYTEASQSGVVAEALRHGMPAIVTPVGALPEQVDFGQAGLVAAACEPGAFSHEIGRALRDERLLSAVSGRAVALVHARIAASPWRDVLRHGLGEAACPVSPSR